MKKLMLFFWLVPVKLWSQYSIDFENDSVLTRSGYPDILMEQWPPGSWERSDLEVISGNFSLHHSFDNHLSGTDMVSFTHDPPDLGDTIFVSFRIRHAYPPSSANNWQVALLAEMKTDELLRGRIVEGIVLGVNYIGSDDLVKVWVLSDSHVEEVMVSSVNFQEDAGTSAAPLFSLSMDDQGKVVLYYSSDPSEGEAVVVGECHMDHLPRGRRLIIRYEYSAAQDRKLWLDDLQLEGHFIKDTLAPRVEQVAVIDENRLLIGFTEPVIISDSVTFYLKLSADQPFEGVDHPGLHTPGSYFFQDEQLVLDFCEKIPNRATLNLFISGICDADSNCMADTTISLMRNITVWGDVVFSEVLFDPAPPVQLPDCEYVEIFNRSAFDCSLEGWDLVINEKSYRIPDLKLSEGEAVILTGPCASDAYERIRSVQLVGASHILPNGGGTLSLYSRDDRLIHGARYVIPWNGPEWKKTGGWAIESPDHDRVCNISGLWEFSVDPSGGTPGRFNSNRRIIPDQDSPVFLYAGEMKQGRIRLKFSEPVGLSGQGNLIRSYTEDTGIPRATLAGLPGIGGVSNKLGSILLLPLNISPDSVVPELPIADAVTLCFAQETPLTGDFQLKLDSIIDCSGNMMEARKINLGSVSSPVYGSVLINEIMYDPQEGSIEFIELYNPGKEFYDIRDLSVDVVAQGESLRKPVPLSQESRLLSPGEFLVISRNNQLLMDAYALEISGLWLQLEQLDLLSNSGGTVYLTDRSGNTIDMAEYSDRMHTGMLDHSKGVSLERISSGKPGSDPANWHSAASIEGYCTPGRQNSQSADYPGSSGPESADLLRVEPAVFSPDNNGYQDVLIIYVVTGREGEVISLWITDLSGYLVRNLASNHLTGPSIRYSWDGEREDGGMCPEGFYVIHLTTYHQESGQSRQSKVATGLIYR